MPTSAIPMRSKAIRFRGVGEIELPAPGLGSLNYDLYLKRLAQKHPNIPMIIEHLDESDVPRAKKFLDGKLAGAGPLMTSRPGWPRPLLRQHGLPSAGEKEHDDG